MKIFGTTLTTLILFAGFACQDPDYPDSIYDPNPEVLPNPVITNIDPPDRVFAGIGVVTITGQNFHTRNDYNLVYFNGNSGTLLSSTETELIVQTPNIIADSVKIQVAVIGAYEFAEIDNYELYPPVVVWAGDNFASLYGTAMDAEENLYISESGGREILRIFPNGEADSLVYGDHGGFIKADAMRVGPEGKIYIARRNKKLSSIPAGGGEAEDFLTLPNNTRAYSLDFDQHGNLYTGGRKNELYRINVVAGESEFSSVAIYPVDVHVNVIRVFDDHVYIVGEYIGDDTTVVQEGIWRSQIVSADSLAPPELVINWQAIMGSTGPTINDFTFSLDGYMYIGPSSDYALYEIAPPYTDQPINPKYAEVLEAPADRITWGNGSYLYLNTRSIYTSEEPTAEELSKKRVFRVDMVRQGAPYYGRSF